MPENLGNIHWERCEEPSRKLIHWQKSLYTQKHDNFQGILAISQSFEEVFVSHKCMETCQLNYLPIHTISL